MVQTPNPPTQPMDSSGDPTLCRILQYEFDPSLTHNLEPTFFYLLNKANSTQTCYRRKWKQFCVLRCTCVQPKSTLTSSHQK